MMKIITTILLLIQSFQSYSQDWVRIYGQDQEAVGRYVIEDYDKGYNILGMVNYYKYSWLVKTNINGNILWNKRFGNGHFDVGSSNIEKTPDGGSIICGTWTKFNTSFDAFLIKLNACGEVEWCKTLITPTNYDMGIRIKPSPEGDYLLLGAYFLTEPYSNTSLFKFNSSGELIWHQFYPLEDQLYNDLPYDLLIDDDGYLILTDRYFPDPGTNTPYWIRHHFIKTDTSGNQTWELTYGVDDYFYGFPWAVKKSKNGDFYEAGNQVVPGIGHTPAFVKVKSDGTQLYHKAILSGTQYGGMSSIDFLNDSLLIMVGGWTKNDTSYDVFFKTDTLGNFRKSFEIPLLSSGYWWATKVHDNKFITIGNDATGATWKIYAVKVNSDLEYDSIYSQPFTYDSLCPYPIVSDTVDPDCDNVFVGIDEPFKNPETTKLKVFPNPARDFVTVEMPKYLVVTNTTSKIPSTTIYHVWGSALLEIYDLFGKKLFEKEVIRSETNLTIDVSRWPKGMYFCRLAFIKQTVGSEKLLVE